MLNNIIKFMIRVSIKNGYIRICEKTMKNIALSDIIAWKTIAVQITRRKTHIFVNKDLYVE